MDDVPTPLATGARPRTPRATIVLTAVVGLLFGGVIGVVAAPAVTKVGAFSERWAGNDRYETSVAISQARWTKQNTTTVFLATGGNYPDALSLAASTGDEGPILLVRSDTLPDIVRTEITRLQPCRIVAVGGVNAVSGDVLASAEAATQRDGCPDV